MSGEMPGQILQFGVAGLLLAALIVVLKFQRWQTKVYIDFLTNHLEAHTKALINLVDATERLGKVIEKCERR